MRRHILYLFSTLLLAGFSTPALASSQSAEAETVDVQEIIFSHIQDSYEWHVTTIGEHHITVPLPVIVRSSERGWYVFSSSHLHHGAYEGFYLAGADSPHKGKIVEMNSAGEEVRPLDMSFTKNAAALVINGLIMCLIFVGVARWYSRRPAHSVPKGFVGAVEMFVMSIHDDLICPCVGPNFKRYVPYLLTAFFFIFINNLMGLVPFFPGGASTTGNIAVTMVLALCTFFAVNFWGTKEYWKEVFWPDVPVWMKFPVPLMPAIELFGVFTKPFALMIRLFANIMAGHAIVLGLVCMVFLTAKMSPAISGSMTFVSVLMNIFMGCLELLVAYIQAYVFTMMSAVFIGLSQAEPHHKHEKVETNK